MTDKEMAEKGKELAQIFMLREDFRHGTYITAWGHKTPLGIYEMFRTIYLRGDIDICGKQGHK